MHHLLPVCPPPTLLHLHLTTLHHLPHILLINRILLHLLHHLVTTPILQIIIDLLHHCLHNLLILGQVIIILIY